MVMATRRSSRRLEQSKYHFKNGKKIFGELQALQHHLSCLEADEQLLMKTVSRHVNDKTAIVNSQRGFTKGISC